VASVLNNGESIGSWQIKFFSLQNVSGIDQKCSVSQPSLLMPQRLEEHCWESCGPCLIFDFTEELLILTLILRPGMVVRVPKTRDG